MRARTARTNTRRRRRVAFAGRWPAVDEASGVLRRVRPVYAGRWRGYWRNTVCRRVPRLRFGSAAQGPGTGRGLFVLTQRGQGVDEFWWRRSGCRDRLRPVPCQAAGVGAFQAFGGPECHGWVGPAVRPDWHRRTRRRASPTKPVRLSSSLSSDRFSQVRRAVAVWLDQRCCTRLDPGEPVIVGLVMRRSRVRFP
jgi:hypothetical protein